MGHVLPVLGSGGMSHEFEVMRFASMGWVSHVFGTAHLSAGMWHDGLVWPEALPRNLLSFLLHWL